ncbi:hypothetical protein PG994_008758 [Apiospora phragmitis]|uniref:Uncharacterized protein n=1 Tax=Apiospora phragmitis TaxID=2905665 RepID=A0ABR1UJT0_9PEZI
MFDIPEAKRVRREDLYSSAPPSDDDGDDLMSQDGQVDTELRERLRAQLAGLLDLDILSPSSLPAPGAADTPAQKSGTAVASDEGANNPPTGTDGELLASDANNPDEVALTFRLFRDEEPSHTVVIKQGDETQSYYLADTPDQETMAQFKFAAMSTEYLMANAKQRKWGLEKPWRVTKITVAADKIPKTLPDVDGVGDTTMGESKRTRPGKKRRVLLRTRDKAKREKEEAVKKKLADKEEHLKEKRKRLNKAKKLKRREKRRSAKGAGGEGADEPSSRETSPE